MIQKEMTIILNTKGFLKMSNDHCLMRIMKSRVHQLLTTYVCPFPYLMTQEVQDPEQELEARTINI